MHKGGDVVAHGFQCSLSVPCFVATSYLHPTVALLSCAGSDGAAGRALGNAPGSGQPPGSVPAAAGSRGSGRSAVGEGGGCCTPAATAALGIGPALCTEACSIVGVDCAVCGRRGFYMIEAFNLQVVTRFTCPPQDAVGCELLLASGAASVGMCALAFHQQGTLPAAC